MGENLGCEYRRSGRYLRVDEDEREEDFVDVGSNFFGLFVHGGCPVGGGDTIAYYASDSLDRGAGVGVKELLVDLTKYVSNGCRFVSELDRECVFELRR